MSKLRNMMLVTGNLIGELWLGVFRKNSEFYDKYSKTDTRVGYIIFIASVSIVTIGILSWITVQ